MANRKNEAMFKDLGGMGSLIEELKNKVFFRSLTGILLYGPPGCGKSTLAHAIANENGFRFYEISAPEVNSQQQISELFNEAYSTTPSIIFISEIEAIASKRESLTFTGKLIMLQLKTCMDARRKLVQTETGYVLVIGTTNQPDALDPAFRISGRFDREFRLGVPDENARNEILEILTENCTLEGSVDLLQIAKSTAGFVGADLHALVDKARHLAMMRISEKEHAITMADFEQAAKVVQPPLRRGFSSLPNVKWDDVGGLADIKQELNRHLVGRIKGPELYRKFGVSNLQSGILLYGPPGCGKTLIAKAAANEAGANFILIKCPELLSEFIGESESNVRTLFERARTCSPCVLFFDEVDVLTTTRGKGGSVVADQLSSQFMIELEGASDEQDIYIIGATNRKEVMDHAVLRPGRFGILLEVPLPSADERGMILNALVRGKPIDTSVDLSAIGRMEACNNWSGADLKKLVDEAVKAASVESSMNLSEERLNTIKAAHFVEALKKISASVSMEVWSERDNAHESK